MRSAISANLSEEHLRCTALWSPVICCLMGSFFLSSLIMSHITWDSHDGNALLA